MGIGKYFTQTWEIFSKTRAKVNGVNKETLVSQGTVKGRLDPGGSTFNFITLRETFEFTDILFCEVNSNITVDKVMEWNGTQYDVVSVVDPLTMSHHLEVLLNRRS